MPNYQRRIVYLSDVQYQQLIANGSITVGNVTVTYSESDLYVTPQDGVVSYTMVAPEYSDLTFPVTKGQACIHSGGYYTANQAIQESEVWTSAHWDGPTMICDEILDLVNDKADKVSGAVNGNFATLDSNGNLTDSGHKHSDYLTSHQDISGKLDTSDFYATEMPMSSLDSTKVSTEISGVKSAINSMNPAATSSEVGKFLKVKTVADGKPTEWEYGEASGGGSGLPDVTSSDNGKFLRVVDGAWAAATVPVWQGGSY